MSTLFPVAHRHLALEYAAYRLSSRPPAVPVGDLYRRWLDGDEPFDACRMLAAEAADPGEMVMQLRVLLAYLLDEMPEPDSFAGFTLERILTDLAVGGGASVSPRPSTGSG